jgi:thioesterase domain-containing protein
LLGWGDAVKGGVDVVDVPGNHQTLLHQPYVQVLADHLTAALAAISASA